ncbi:MAG: HRDC domain-containing protein [Dehalococcoidales bacterium]|nr:HRDC domain-containing protein [Dehalococcoidales bacterium]
MYEAESRGVSLLTSSLPLPVEIVSRPAQLGVAAREMAGSHTIALDTESNSFHHYPEQLCLIQIASRHKVYIIDTIALYDLAPLRDVLADVSIKKVVHAADYDIRSLDRYCGLHIHNLFDTSIAARFTGIAQLGLAALTRDLLGITINKSKRLQRADWGRRPLSAEALEYAATDVRHLFALREVLDQRLRTLGRAAWVAEECARIEEIRYTAPNLETAYLSVKGAKDLDGRGLAVLQSLFLFREEEARRQHRPPFFILPDATLIFLATSPEAALSEIPGLGQTGLKRFGQGLQQALHNGITAPPIHRPHPIKAVRASEEQVQRLSRLKEWRTSLGSSLSLDPSLLWPLTSLQRLAKAPDTLSVEFTSDNIRHWQRDVVASSLQACLSQ